MPSSSPAVLIGNRLRPKAFDFNSRRSPPLFPAVTESEHGRVQRGRHGKDWDDEDNVDGPTTIVQGLSNDSMRIKRPTTATKLRTRLGDELLNLDNFPGLESILYGPANGFISLTSAPAVTGAESCLTIRNVLAKPNNAEAEPRPACYLYGTSGPFFRLLIGLQIETAIFCKSEEVPFDASYVVSDILVTNIKDKKELSFNEITYEGARTSFVPLFQDAETLQIHHGPQRDSLSTHSGAHEATHPRDVATVYLLSAFRALRNRQSARDQDDLDRLYSTFRSASTRQILSVRLEKRGGAARGTQPRLRGLARARGADAEHAVRRHRHDAGGPPQYESCDSAENFAADFKRVFIMKFEFPHETESIIAQANYIRS
ncbi:hypothetical protein B0H11DRAFT_1912383 [Mycena galericulata]|nr:hypothetical protein B0H11DRAFT_1912383 [Mycena galericulata]